jgi:AcrR family transcriptional regulator
VDRRERTDKRVQILDAALAVFSRKGVFASRIADIASEAGIAYGLVYHYFRNKEEILNTIFEERWARVTELLEEAEDAGETCRDQLEGAVEVFISSYRDRPQVVELLLLEFSRMSKFLEPVHLEQIGRAFAVVTRILETAQKAGEIRSDVPAPLLMLVFLGGIQLILQSEVFGGVRLPEGFAERGAETVVDVFWEGVSAK